jgi:hypothetical protein
VGKKNLFFYFFKQVKKKNWGKKEFFLSTLFIEWFPQIEIWQPYFFKIIW